jgi:hypothetical protein
MENGVNGSMVAVLVGVWATFALDVFSTLNSSPQTTELFAADRKESLMHWVLVGTGVAIGGGLAATVISKKPWPLIATVLVAGGMFYAYNHAVVRGEGQKPPANGS